MASLIAYDYRFTVQFLRHQFYILPEWIIDSHRGNTLFLDRYCPISAIGCLDVNRPFSDEDWNNTPEPVKSFDSSQGHLRLLWKNGKSGCPESIYQWLRPPVIISNMRTFRVTWCKSANRTGFLPFFLGLPISTGGIQCVIDRISNAIKPIYNEIGNQACGQEVNGIDETSWFKSGKIHWLWTIVNSHAQLVVNLNRFGCFSKMMASSQPTIDPSGRYDLPFYGENVATVRKATKETVGLNVFSH